jgi:hypothetical protein
MEQGKSVSMGEESGEGVDATLPSDTLRYLQSRRDSHRTGSGVWTDASVCMCERSVGTGRVRRLDLT